MQETIAKLWYGDFDFIRYFGLNNEKMKEIENIMRKNLEDLGKDCSSKQKEILEQYENNFGRYIVVSSEQAFCDGFSLAVKLMSEAISGANDKF